MIDRLKMRPSPADYGLGMIPMILKIISPNAFMTFNEQAHLHNFLDVIVSFTIQMKNSTQIKT